MAFSVTKLIGGIGKGVSRALGGQPQNATPQGDTGHNIKKSTGGGWSGMAAGYDEYKRGGKVRKTGLAKLHKGERVLTKRQAKRYRKVMAK